MNFFKEVVETREDQLAAYFQTAYRSQLDACLTNPSALEMTLRQIVHTAQERWPDLLLPPVEFVRYAADHLPLDRPVMQALQELCVADLFLAWACMQGDRQALRLFDKCYIKLIPDYIRNINNDAFFADDVSQILRERLLVSTPQRGAKLSEYSGRSPLGAWLRITARRTAIDLHRKSHPKTDELRQIVIPYISIGSNSADESYDRARFQILLSNALDAAIAKLSNEQRNLIYLYYTKEHSMESIASVLSLCRSTVKRRLDAIKELLANQIKLYWRQQQPISSEEFASLMKILITKTSFVNIVHSSLCRSNP